MPTNTTKFNLVKPLKSEKYNVDVFNGNADIIDSQLAENENRIDNIITTPVPTGEVIAQEIIDARQGAGSLGANITDVKSQLAEKADKTYVDAQLLLKASQTQVNDIEKETDLFALQSFPKYGEIDFSQFSGLNHNLNFKVYRDVDGLMKHTYVHDETGYAVRYVDRLGSSGNNGLTPATPWGSLTNAVQQIEADGAITKAKIIIQNVIDRTDSVIALSQSITKKYIITAENPVGPNQWVTSYSVHSGSVVKGACAFPVSGVARINEKDSFGKSKTFLKVNSVNDCIANPDSFYSDGVDVYINRADTSNTNTMVFISSGLWQFNMQAGAEVILKDVELISGSSSQPCYFRGTTALTGKVICDNVIVNHLGGGTTANGISTDNILDIKLFNCKVFNVIRDGFNYHSITSTSGGGTVFEYNCFAENTGRDSAESNNNISTAHEAIHIIRIGTKGRKSKGPLIADVNGCKSLNIDVEVYNTGLSGTSPGNTAFYFDDAPTTNVPSPNGKAWLINCAGGSTSEFGISGDASFKNVNKIYVDNFRGRNIPSDVVLTPLAY